VGGKKQYQEVEAIKAIEELREIFASLGGHDAFWAYLWRHDIRSKSLPAYSACLQGNPQFPPGK
jgi:hypothetical protein